MLIWIAVFILLVAPCLFLIASAFEERGHQKRKLQALQQRIAAKEAEAKKTEN